MCCNPYRLQNTSINYGIAIETSFSFCALERMICIFVRLFVGFVPPASALAGVVVVPAGGFKLASLAVLPLIIPSNPGSTPPPRNTPGPGPPPGVAPAYRPPEIGFADRPLPSSLPPRPAAASGPPRPSPARAKRPPPEVIFACARMILFDVHLIHFCF